MWRFQADDGLRAKEHAYAGQTKNIDAYLKPLPAEQRTALQKLRKQIRALVPKPEECFSYDLPAFRLGRLAELEA